MSGAHYFSLCIVELLLNFAKIYIMVTGLWHWQKTWVLSSASGMRAFLFAYLLVCFYRKPHFNHLDYLLVLINSRDLRKLIKYQKEICATDVF